MSNRESTSRTLMVALAVSLVSSVFVAGAAVSLKPVQVENRLLDKQRSILSIAGLGDAEMSSREVKDLFAGRIKARVVDLQTGEYTDAHDAQLFDPLKAARDPKLSDALDGGFLGAPVELPPSSWGSGKDWQVWSGPKVADLVALNNEVVDTALSCVDKALAQTGSAPARDTVMAAARALI